VMQVLLFLELTYADFFYLQQNYADKHGLYENVRPIKAKSETVRDGLLR
jgi:hypothetical protein